MILFSEKSRILVLLELPEPEELPELMFDLFESVRVLLVGWYEVPEQTSPEQAREEVDDTGEEALEAVAERFREAGAEVETRQIFTPDPIDTVRRLGVEEECTAALISGPIHALDRILMVLREKVSPDLVVPLMADLSGGGSRRITLLHFSKKEADEGRDRAQRMLERLEERGLDTGEIETRVETSGEPEEAVLEACRDGDYDVVIVPETGDLEDQLFGSFAERVAREASLPVLVVRGEGG